MPVRAGHEPARTVSAVTKPTHPGRSGPTSATAASWRSSRNHPIRSVIENGVDPPAAGRRPSTNYKGRNVVERNFNIFKQWRALATRYDKLALTYRGGAVLRAVSIWLTALGDTP